MTKKNTRPSLCDAMPVEQCVVPHTPKNPFREDQKEAHEAWVYLETRGFLQGGISYDTFLANVREFLSSRPNALAYQAHRLTLELFYYLRPFRCPPYGDETARETPPQLPTDITLRKAEFLRACVKSPAGLQVAYAIAQGELPKVKVEWAAHAALGGRSWRFSVTLLDSMSFFKHVDPSFENPRFDQMAIQYSGETFYNEVN